jgi:ribose 5-phosphate isomerase A
VAFAFFQAQDERLTPSALKYLQGVPIEVVPFTYAKVLQNLQELLGSPDATLRMAKMKAGPVVSDNANFLIDAPFPVEVLKDPYPVCFLLFV